MRLVVHGGVVVSPSGLLRTDLVAEDGVIVAWVAAGDRWSSDTEVIDATGLLVFPGFIDPHVHSRDPGLTEKEDFVHSTGAAAAGGVTTILEMPNAIPPVTDSVVLESRKRAHSAVAYVDFGLWALSLGAANLSDLGGMLEAGAVGVKLFWGYAFEPTSGRLVFNWDAGDARKLLLPPREGEVLEVMRTVARYGSVLAAHCENREVIEVSERSLGHPIRSYDDLLAVRSELAEASAVAMGVELARATGARFHVLHASAARTVTLVSRAQADGIAVSAETCPHYLTLTDADYGKLGTTMKVYPPVRRSADQEALWQGINCGTICSVSSDHAPHTSEEKASNLAEAPAGGVGVETLPSVLLNEMTLGRISAERLSWILAEGSAKLYGLYPRKGCLQPGSDADVTLVDPHAVRRVANSRLHSKVKVSAWDGAELRGVPIMSILRGKVIMRGGELVGERCGRFVAAERSADSAGPDLNRPWKVGDSIR